jgi:hypothetical protein
MHGSVSLFLLLFFRIFLKQGKAGVVLGALLVID